MSFPLPLASLRRGRLWLLVLLACWLAGGRAAQAQQAFFDVAYLAGNTLPGGGESWVGALARDAQGNVYVGGYFAGRLNFGSLQLTSHASHFDVFVAKYSADGDLAWVQQGGLDGDEKVLALAVDATGNVYVGGYYIGPTQFGAYTLAANPGPTNVDAYVARLDAAGNWQWLTGAGGSGDDSVTGLALGTGGQLTAAGTFGAPSASFGATQLTNYQSFGISTDIFVAQLGLAGNWLGAVAAGGLGQDAVTGLALDASGAAYVCGSFDGAQAQFGAATLTNTALGSSDGFVAKYAASGAWQWATGLGGSGHDYLRALALDAGGQPYVTGQFASAALTVGGTLLTNAATGTNDVLVAALTTSGTWRWATRAGGSRGESGTSLAVSPTGQVTVAGQFSGTSLTLGPTVLTSDTPASYSSPGGTSEAFVGWLGATGTWLGGLAPGGVGSKYASHTLTTTDGDTYLAGYFWGQAQVGEYTLQGNNFLPNCFVAHLADATAVAQLSGAAPASAAAGQTVTLTGSRFASVQSVRFNGVPATSFAATSATQLTAVVPAGATSGPVRVRTAAGTSRGLAFSVQGALAGAGALATEPAALWPNPVASREAVQLRLPAHLVPTGPTRAELRNCLGQLVLQTEFGGRELTWALPLPPGLYQLTLYPAGQPTSQQRLLVR